MNHKSGITFLLFISLFSCSQIFNDNNSGPGVPHDIPANPMIMAVNSCSIGLTWLPPNDGVGITGYNIYRDGALAGFSDESVYNDNSNLSSDTLYTYRISALDENGNESAQSEPVSAATLSVPVYINPDSEVIPAHSLADWSSAGVVGGIPEYASGVNVLNYGAAGNGSTDDTAAVNAAIAACPEYQAVFFPEGVYLLSDTVYVSKPVVLRGAGPEATILRDSHRNATITFYQDASYAGIEDLHVEVVYQYDNTAGTKIAFINIENSWIKNIETSGYTDRTVDIQTSSHCEIRDSYFHHSEEEAVNEGYTHWYGVHVVGYEGKANYNLVENNIFDWYSSPMIIQHEAHYNVYAYNFSWHTWGGDGAPSVRADFEIHHYDYTNPPYDYGEPPAHKFVYYLLSEGNVFEQGASSQPVHRKNIFFRNRVTNGGINLNSANIAFGNEFTEKKNPGTFNPGASDDNSIRSIRQNSIAHGNYITVPDLGMQWDPDISDHTIPDSYYLESKPDFFADLPWPCYGAELMPGNVRQNPAEMRYWSMFPDDAPDA